MDILTPAQKKQLRTLEKQGVFRLAVQNAYNHIIITDTQGTILYANQATQRITGYAQHEIIGHNPRLWGGQMPEAFYKKLWKRIEEERSPFIGEVTNKRNDGKKYRARITVSPIVEEDGTLIGFVGIEEEIRGEQ